MTGTVNTPPLVLPETVTLPRGDGEFPHVIPSAVIVELPIEVMFPPRVADVLAIDADVGVVTVGVPIEVKLIVRDPLL